VARAKAFSSSLYALEKTRVVFKTVIEPVIVGFKSYQDAGRPSVPRDDDFLSLRLSEKARQIVLHLREWYLLYSRSANRASHASASDLATIALIHRSITLRSR
jgi:hypothetical protein